MTYISFHKVSPVQAFHGGYWVSILNFNVWEKKETNGTRLRPMDISTEITGPFEFM